MRREVWPTSHIRRNMAREESTGPTSTGRVVPKSMGRAVPTFMERSVPKSMYRVVPTSTGRAVPKSMERSVPTSILYTRVTEPEVNVNYKCSQKF